MNNSLVQSQSKPKFSLFVSQEKVKQFVINNLAGDSNRALRLLASVTSAVATNPKLQDCEHFSILNAALIGESLGLSPSPMMGHCYFVPYDVKDVGKVAQFQIGYKGYIQLAMRSGQYKDIDVTDVREGEYLGRDKETGKYLFSFIEDDDEREQKQVIGYMAYFEYLNGFKKVMYWSRAKMEKHADTYSKAFKLSSYKLLLEGKIPEKDMWKFSSFWYKNFDGMAFKTMLRQLISKWGMMSIDPVMQKAYESDMAIIKNDGTPEFIEPEPEKDPTNGNNQQATQPTETPKEPIPNDKIVEAFVSQSDKPEDEKQQYEEYKPNLFEQKK